MSLPSRCRRTALIRLSGNVEKLSELISRIQAKFSVQA